MRRREIFDFINTMQSILENITDDNLLDYCINCLNNNDYACEEDFIEFCGGYVEVEEGDEDDD